MYTIQGTYINNKVEKNNDKIIEHFNGNDYETQKSAKWNELSQQRWSKDCNTPTGGDDEKNGWCTASMVKDG